MRISANFAMLITGWLLMSQTAFRTPTSGTAVREYVKHFEHVGSQACEGYVSFEAKFTGFAGKVSLHQTQLYIVRPSGRLLAAIQKQHIPFQYHQQINAKAYKIPRFTLYLEGHAMIGSSDQVRKYARSPFKLQLSDALGDFTTPEFTDLDRETYRGDNSWEVSGAIADTKLSPLKVTEIYFKDYDIRFR